MADELKDGGQAYPAAWDNPEQGGDYIPGMTLRDRFAIGVDVSGFEFPDLNSAAQAMGEPAPKETDDLAEMMRFGARVQAWIRYQLADAMLTARQKGGDVS